MMKTQDRPRSLARWLAIAALCGALPAVVLAQAVDRRVQRVAVASHEIARGTVLSHSDISYLPAPDPAEKHPAVSSARAMEPATEHDSLVGWMTRRVINTGEPLRAPAVAPPQVVKSGDVVDVVFQGDGVSVSMRGKATRAGAVGDRMVVRMDNQRRIEGMVLASGRIRVL